MPFKGQELIDYYLLRTKYSVYFIGRFIIDILDSVVNFWSLELWKVLRGIISLPSKIFQILDLFKNLNVNFKVQWAIIFENFDFNFGFKYVDPAIAYIEAAILFAYNYILNILKIILNWYILPIESKYSHKFRGYEDFSEFYNFWKLKSMSKESYINAFFILKENYNEILPLLSYIYTRSKEGLGICYDYIYFITEGYFLLLKMKLAPHFRVYLLEFYSRVEEIKGVWNSFNETFNLLVGSYNNFVEKKEVLFIVDILQYIILLIAYLFKNIIEMILIVIKWNCLDIYNFLKNLCKEYLPFIGQTIAEAIVLTKGGFIYFYQGCFYYGYYIFMFLFDLTKALYLFIFEFVSIVIEYIASILGWFLEEVFSFSFYSNLIGTYVYSWWYLLSYFSDIICWLGDSLVNFKLRFLLLRMNMIFTDFWQYITIGEYWWDNIIFSAIYVKASPLLEWVEHNLRFLGPEGSENILIRGDFNRRLPFVIKRNFELPYEEQAQLNSGFNYLTQGRNIWDPIQARSLWVTHGYVLKYIKMLDNTNLPHSLKVTFYKSYLRSLYWETFWAMRSAKIPGLTFKKLDDYFKFLAKQKVFGERVSELKVMDKLVKHDATIFGSIKHVQDTWGVYDPGYIRWEMGKIENGWLFPTLWNDIDYDGLYLLNEDVDDSFEDAFDSEVSEYNEDMYLLPIESIIDYHIKLKEATETYNFMAFNQKIYNFYLDMFGPEFGYIHYHFPGTSVQLNDDRLSYHGRIKWLSDYIYNTKSNLLLNTSMVNRAIDFDFRLYMKGAENWARFNMFQKYYWIDSTTLDFKMTRFAGKPYVPGGLDHKKIVNLQEFIQYHDEFMLIDNDEELDLDFIETRMGTLDESIYGPDDSHLTWWDEIDKQFG